MEQAEQKEIKKEPEVDLDLDGVQETQIDLDDKVEDKHPSEIKKEEVDLGYTDIKTTSEEKAETKKDEIQEEETLQETKADKKEDKDDLSKVSDNAQKRIKELTYKYREAERREKAALEYAKGLKTKYEDVNAKYQSTDEEYLKQYDARIDAERDKVKRQLKDALDLQDTEKVMEANDALTKLAVEKEKVRISLSEKEKAKKEKKEDKPETTINQQINEQAAPQKISPRAQAWAEKNEWFGNDRIMTSAAMTLHDELVGQGFDAETDDYYNEIDKRMKDYFPRKFGNDETTETNNKPVQNVAGVSRKQGGRRSVKLTKSQVAIAKKLGVPLEEYAKFVKEDK